MRGCSDAVRPRASPAFDLRDRDLVAPGRRDVNPYPQSCLKAPVI
jgi:hypothetical protein